MNTLKKLANKLANAKPTHVSNCNLTIKDESPKDLRGY